jgi:hypothetical protein
MLTGHSSVLPCCTTVVAKIFVIAGRPRCLSPLLPTLSSEPACLLRMKASGAVLHSQEMNSVDK